MIDVRDLKQDEYTFAEIAGMFKIDRDVVSSDFKRRKFPSVLKMKIRRMTVGGIVYKSKKPTRVVKKKDVISYSLYVKTKKGYVGLAVS